jgi:CubicO group peptidase (beta-lactamase class C family)
MKRRLWFACGVLVLLIMVVFALGAGHPERLFAGLMSGNEAMAYLPPRRELALQPGPPQPTLSLAEAGVDPESLELSMRYAEARNSDALVVGVNGHIVYQKYWGESSLDSALEASGFSPLLAALVLGTALQNGELRDLDAPVSKFLPEWGQDPRGTITLRDLLTGNSNLQAPGARPWPRSLAARYYLEENLGAHLLAWPQADKPAPAGSPPEVDADILALTLTRALKTNYAAMLTERLWRPMGAGPLSLGIDGKTSSAGFERAGCCLRARLSDWMRIGAMIANAGVLEGNQYVPPEFARLLVTPTHPGSARAVFLKVDGTFAARDVVRLEAAGKQRLWIVPSLKLVILRAGREPPETLGWDEAMIPDNIIRGTRGWQPASTGSGKEVDPNLYAPHH